VTQSKYNAEDTQILGATEQNLVVTANWRPGFVHPWLKQREGIKSAVKCPAREKVVSSKNE